MNFTSTASFIWSVADLLRGDYKQSDYGKVILPFTLLRRLDCVLQETKPAVLAEYDKRKGSTLPLDPILTRKAKQSFFNISPLDFQKLLADPGNSKANLIQYVNGFSQSARDIFERYQFPEQIERLDSANLLYQVIQKFAAVDLHPDTVDNAHMGLVFEELIRRFAELSNETAGEHYTPREVIRLMVNLLFIADDDALTQAGIVRSIYDPAAGTGGMLSIAEEHLHDMNPEAKLVVFGQELNPESFAICKADMLVKGQEVSNIIFGNTLSDDGHSNKTFDYMLSNPPFGVEWKKVEAAVCREYEQKGFAGRFGAGLPRISDGSLLFLMHLLSKMSRVSKYGSEGGSRIGIVLNGSPLFTGGAGSGESDIRKWIIENDWLEAIIALPTDMFYNTGISTYIWMLTNHKKPERKGKIQLINGAEFFQKMRKSLGSKRKELGEGDINRIVQLYGEFESNDYSKIFDNRDFGYSTITVERPLRLNFQASPERIAQLRETTVFIKFKQEEWGKLSSTLAKLDPTKKYTQREAFLKDVKKALTGQGVSLTGPQLKALWLGLSERDETAEVCKDSKGNPEPDTDLRDTENVPLKENIDTYFSREIRPHAPDAWLDRDKTKVGYEVPFTRHFYRYVAPRSLGAIDSELKSISQEIINLLQEITA